MYSLHGDTVTNAIGVSFAYFITALIMLIVLGVLAVGVIIAKVMVVVMAALSLLIIPWAAFSPDGTQKLARFAKFGLGAMVYSFALQFILILVTVVTAFLARVGFAAGGSGSIGSVIWAGRSPILAIVLIKFLFSKILRAPDPLKPSTAMAFGGAMGATGGLATGGALDRLSRRAARAVRPSGRGGHGSDSSPRRPVSDRSRETYEAGRRKRLPDGFEPDKKSKGEKVKAHPSSDRRGKGADRSSADRPKTPPREAPSPAPDKRKAPERPKATGTTVRRPAAGGTGRRADIDEASRLGRAIDRWDFTRERRRKGAILTGAAGAATWAGVGGMATAAAAAFTPPGMVAIGGAGAYYGYRKVQEYRRRRDHSFEGHDPLADSAELDFGTYPRTSGSKPSRARQAPESPMLSVDSVVVSDRRQPAPTQPTWGTTPTPTEPQRLWIPEQRAPRRQQAPTSTTSGQPPTRPGQKREQPKQPRR